MSLTTSFITTAESLATRSFMAHGKSKGTKGVECFCGEPTKLEVHK